MNFPKRQLKHLQSELKPQRGFKHDLWKKLDTAWDARHMPAYAWYQTVQFRIVVPALSVVLIVATVSTSAYAYTSPEVTVGTPLYPIKQQIEAVQEKLQTTPEAKANFALKQLERREAEQKVLEKKSAARVNVVKAEVAITQVVRKLEDTEIKLETVSTTKAKVLQEKIKKRLEERKEELEKRQEQREEKRERAADRKQERLDKIQDEFRSSTSTGERVRGVKIDGPRSDRKSKSDKRNERD